MVEQITVVSVEGTGQAGRSPQLTYTLGDIMVNRFRISRALGSRMEEVGLSSLVLLRSVLPWASWIRKRSCRPRRFFARYISGHLFKSKLYGNKRAKFSTQGQINPTPPAKCLNFKDRHRRHASMPPAPPDRPHRQAGGGANVVEDEAGVREGGHFAQRKPTNSRAPSGGWLSRYSTHKFTDPPPKLPPRMTRLVFT